MRTKGQMRGARQKGRVFERNCEASLKQIDDSYYLTHEVGYQQQYDIRSDKHNEVFECKCLRGMAWNEAKKYFRKLMTVKPTDYKPYLLFKPNQQPCLVLYLDISGRITIQEFEKVFGVPFIKYTPIKRNKSYSKKHQFP